MQGAVYYCNESELCYYPAQAVQTSIGDSDFAAPVYYNLRDFWAVIRDNVKREPSMKSGKVLIERNLKHG